MILFAARALPQSQELIEQSQRGKELMAAQKFDEAAAVYRQLVKAVPDNPGLLLNLGMALHLAGHSHEAIAPLAQATRLDADVLPAWLFLGASYLAVGEPARALAPLQKYVHQQPQDPGGHQTLADALFALDRFADAANEYKRLGDLESANPHAYYGLNRSYSALSQAAFQKVEESAPQSAWWFALVADERVRRLQFHSAFFFYKKAEELMPHLSDLHLSIAKVYVQTGHPDWAATERKKETAPDCKTMPQACDFAAGRYGEIIRAAGDSVPARYWQSRAFALLAEDAFDQLARLPKGPEIHELRAQQFSDRRQTRESVAEWREALQYAPNDEHLREELLSALYRAKENSEALKLADELLRQNPSSPGLNFTKGDILLSSQRPEQAIPFLEKAVRLNPNLIPAQHALGRAYMQVDRQSAAIPHLEKALPIDTDGSLHYQLSRAYQATGKPELAAKMLAQSRERQKSDQEAKTKLESEMQITPP